MSYREVVDCCTTLSLWLVISTGEDEIRVCPEILLVSFTQVGDCWKRHSIITGTLSSALSII